MSELADLRRKYPRGTKYVIGLTARDTLPGTCGRPSVVAGVDHEAAAVNASVTRSGLSQNVTSVFSGDPVPPVTGIGLIVIMNSQRFSFAAVSASCSRSWLSRM